MKTQNPLIGRASQKFANSIFQTWKGINVVRSKPIEVSNPQSPAQTTQRGKFTQMVNLGRQYLNTAKLGLKGLAIRKSEFNVFIGENIALQSDDGQGISDSNIINLVGSKGTLSKLNNVAYTGGGATTLVTWLNSDRPFSTPQDRICFGAFYENALFRTVSYREVSRTTLATAQSATLNVPSILVNGQLKGFSFLIAFAFNDENVADSTVTSVTV